MSDPSSAVWLAARLRHTVETLLELQADSDAARLSKPSAAIAEAALQASRAYEQLIKIASQPAKPPARKQLDDAGQQLPF